MYWGIIFGSIFGIIGIGSLILFIMDRIIATKDTESYRNTDWTWKQGVLLAFVIVSFSIALICVPLWCGTYFNAQAMARYISKTYDIKVTTEDCFFNEARVEKAILEIKDWKGHIEIEGLHK